MFLVLTGYSGSGKTELGKFLEKNDGWVKAVTNTTREPRVGEVQDKDYHFRKDKEEFFSLDLIEWAEYPKGSGKFYGLDAGEVKAKRDGKTYAILEVNGATKVKSLFPDAKIVFIDCSFETLKNRMIARGDSLENVKQRLENIFNSEEKTTSLYADVVIDNNGKIEDTFESLLKFLNEN